jgi:hypothetical protein
MRPFRLTYSAVKRTIARGIADTINEYIKQVILLLSIFRTDFIAKIPWVDAFEIIITTLVPTRKFAWFIRFHNNIEKPIPSSVSVFRRGGIMSLEVGRSGFPITV